MISNSNIIENEIKEKISELEKQHNVKLSTIQKIILSTNGPISTVLSALYEKVNLFTLRQHFEKTNPEAAKKVEYGLKKLIL